MVDDPLAGPGGVGYSWFRLEVVSYYVGTSTPGTAQVFILKQEQGETIITKTQVARAWAKLINAFTFVFKTQQATSKPHKLQRAFTWLLRYLMR